MSEEPETKELVFAPTRIMFALANSAMLAGNIATSGSVTEFPEREKRALLKNTPNGTCSLRYFPKGPLFTLVGRRYLDDQFPHKPFATAGSPAFTEVLSCRTIYYTAPVAATPSRIEREVMALSATSPMSWKQPTALGEGSLPWVFGYQTHGVSDC